MTLDAPLKSAQRRRTCGRRFAPPTFPQGEQNQKKRKYDVLPKPDKLIRYRQILHPRFHHSRPHWRKARVGYQGVCVTLFDEFSG